MRLLLYSEKDTFELGVKIANTIIGGEIILLNGEMGAGKTALTKGIAHGLDIKTEISSPTFTLLNSYCGRLILHHYDFFRLESIDEAEESGLTEFFGDRSGVCVIEWADKLDIDFGCIRVIRINMKYIDDNTRQATLNGFQLTEGTDK